MTSFHKNNTGIVSQTSITTLKHAYKILMFIFNISINQLDLNHIYDINFSTDYLWWTFISLSYSMMSLTFWIATCRESKSAFFNEVVLWWLLIIVSVLLEYIGTNVQVLQSVWWG
jgi:hypothetical protein